MSDDPAVSLDVAATVAWLNSLSGPAARVQPKLSALSGDGAVYAAADGVLHDLLGMVELLHRDRGVVKVDLERGEFGRLVPVVHVVVCGEPVSAAAAGGKGAEFVAQLLCAVAESAAEAVRRLREGR